ncbi:MAG: ATP-binding protein [bacterium]
MNPFKVGVIQPEETFCNREKEIRDILNFIKNSTSAIIFSPRRYGKTSLVKKVLSEIKKKGYYTVYVDFFPVTSTDDVIRIFAARVIEGMGKKVLEGKFQQKLKNIFRRLIPTIDIKPEGLSISVKYDSSVKADYLLEDIFKGIDRYLKQERKKAVIAFDEFQEITRLPESKKIEGIMRSFIQEQRSVSYLFIGSRRRILLSMFSQKNRPFYKAAMNYQINKIDKGRFVPYLCVQFERTGKLCPSEIGEEIYEYAQGHPYYVQKISYLLWDMTKKKANKNLLEQAKKNLVNTETVEFENLFQGLAQTQKQVIKVLAKQPTDTLFSKEFIKQFGFSLGGLQKAIKTLIELDIIEKCPDGVWRLVDPIMAKWLG